MNNIKKELEECPGLGYNYVPRTKLVAVSYKIGYDHIESHLEKNITSKKEMTDLYSKGFELLIDTLKYSYDYKKMHKELVYGIVNLYKKDDDNRISVGDACLLIDYCLMIITTYNNYLRNYFSYIPFWNINEIYIPLDDNVFNYLFTKEFGKVYDLSTNTYQAIDDYENEYLFIQDKLNKFYNEFNQWDKTKASFYLDILKNNNKELDEIIFSSFMFKRPNEVFTYYPYNNYKRIFIKDSKTIGGIAPDTEDDKITIEIDNKRYYPAFMGHDEIRNIKFKGDVLYIGEYSFSDCKCLEEVTLSMSTLSIKENAFMGCTKLKKIYLNNKLSEINKNAFKGCTKLSSIDYDGTKEEFLKIKIDKNAFAKRNICVTFNDLSEYILNKEGGKAIDY